MRIALVSRRFWPLVGGAERVMASLAEQFRNLGHDPVMLTAQWDRHWPTEIEHVGTPVIRLPQPQVRGWGTLRYMWSLGTWLKSHAEELDAVLVSMLKHDAYAALGALNTRLPVFLRAEGAGPMGDCQWQNENRFGPRIQRRCEQAAGYFAPSEEIAAELRASNFSASRVHYVPNGVALPPFRTRERQLAARNILAEANPDLRVGEQTPAALYTGRLHTAKGLHDLVRAWQRVITLWPDARLWLVGEGPEREALYDRLRDHELKYHVAMPGAFDDVTELLYAADVFVLPSYEEGMSLALLEAMAAGLPVVASDIPGNRPLITHGEEGLLFPIKNAVALAEAIAEAITLREESSRRAQLARTKVEQEFSAQRMAERHLAIMQGKEQGASNVSR